MKSVEVRSTLKHSELINGNAQDLSYFKNLTLHLIT